MPGSVMGASLTGLDKAFEMQGGLQGIEEVRTDAGVYLYHDVGDYLSRAQTYQVGTQVTIDTSPGLAVYQAASPSAAGIPFGRYLTAMGIMASSLTALVGWSLWIGNTGIQTPDFPAISYPTPIMYGGTTGFNTRGVDFCLTPTYAAQLPIWCPPGTYILAYVNTSGSGGTYSIRTVWHTSEHHDNAGLPIGVPRAPVKV